MTAAEFDQAIAGFGWHRLDRWHIDTGDGTLVRPGAVSRKYSEQLAFLLRRRAAIQAVSDEAANERRLLRSPGGTGQARTKGTAKPGR